MPTRDKSRNGWRGQVKWRGKVYRHDFKTRKDAVEWEAKTKAQLANQPQTQTQIVTDLGTFCNEYLDNARLRCVPHTYAKKQRICRRFLAYVGNIPVEDVTPKLAQDYLNEQAETRSVGCYNDDYAHLRAAWSWGMRILDLPTNPFAKIGRLPEEHRPQYTPTTEEILRVLAVANREERVFLNAYLMTGARKSEIFRWTWHDDVNFEQRKVRLGTRKTRGGSMSYEWLPMGDELYETLWGSWRNRPIRNSPYVFPSTHPRFYGKPYVARHHFVKDLCQRARVTVFNYHALRRYVASVLADEHKISSKTIQRVLRHKNLSTTERYIKKINEDLQSTMNLLGKKGIQEGHPKDGSEVGNKS